MRGRFIPLALTLAVLLAGAVAAAVGAGDVARRIWMVGLVMLGAPIVFRTLRGGAARPAGDGRRRVAVDHRLGCSDQPLAGLVIVLMQTGGEALERYAEGRASAAVRALEEAAPRIGHRVDGERSSTSPSKTSP